MLTMATDLTHTGEAFSEDDLSQQVMDYRRNSFSIVAGQPYVIVRNQRIVNAYDFALSTGQDEIALWIRKRQRNNILGGILAIIPSAPIFILGLSVGITAFRFRNPFAIFIALGSTAVGVSLIYVSIKLIQRKVRPNTIWSQEEPSRTRGFELALSIRGSSLALNGSF